MKIINRIKELRKKQGLTQLELAKILGVSRVMIYHLENKTNNISDVYIEKLEKALKCKFNKIIVIKKGRRK